MKNIKKFEEYKITEAIEPESYDKMAKIIAYGKKGVIDDSKKKYILDKIGEKIKSAIDKGLSYKEIKDYIKKFDK